MERFQSIGYKITFEPLKDGYRPSSQEIAIGQKAFQFINEGKKITPYFLEQLEDNVDKYPNFPALKNYLILAYKKINDQQAVDDLLEEIMEVHPNYIFGRTLMAEEYLKDNEPKKAAALMADFTDLTHLFPNRDTFHISEVQAFHGLSAQYFAYIGDFEQSKIRVDILEKVGVPPDKILIIKKLCNNYSLQGKKFRDS